MKKIIILIICSIAILQSYGQMAESLLKLGDIKAKKGDYTSAIAEYNLMLFEHFKGKILNVKMLNSICDTFDCNIKLIFNKECLTEGVIISKS